MTRLFSLLFCLVLIVPSFGQDPDDLPPPPDVVQSNVHLEDVYPGSVHRIFGWAAEPRHTYPSRPDEGNEVDDTSLTYWLGQPFVPPLNVASQDEMTIVCNDDEADIIIVQVMIDGKPDIVDKHVNGDGTINWDGVAGENDNQHDHWPNAFGILRVENFDNAQDRVIVTGHTVTAGGTMTQARLDEIIAREGGENGKLAKDVGQFGDLNVGGGVFTRIYSQQGAGGGAHDEDTLGFIVFPDNDEVDKPETVHTNVGVAETIAEFDQLVEYYAAVHEAFSPAIEVGWLNYVAFLAEYGLSPDDFSDLQNEFLYEWFGPWDE